MRYRKANHTGTDNLGADSRRTDRAREAGRILDQSLSAAREEGSGPTTSFAILRTLMESRARRQAASKENTIMSAITKPLTTHRKLSFGVVFAALVFAFLTLVPFEYQRTTGYELNLAGINPSANLNAEVLEGVLSALGYNDTQFEVHRVSDELRCRVRDLPTQYAAREVAAAVSSITGSTPTADVTPQVETVSGSLYAQVKCELSDFDDFDFEGKTDDEVKAEIEKRLAQKGCDDATVRVVSKTNAEGKESREICVKVADGSSGVSSAMCTSGFFDDMDVDTKDKTDAEVAELIRKRCEEKGQSGVEVSVTTRADGKRRIEIKCKPQ